jgi:hypothetical protein
MDIVAHVLWAGARRLRASAEDPLQENDLLVDPRSILLLGGSHVLIDTPSHSADYYAVFLFYRVSESAFNGMSWRHEPSA